MLLSLLLGLLLVDIVLLLGFSLGERFGVWFLDLLGDLFLFTKLGDFEREAEIGDALFRLIKVFEVFIDFNSFYNVLLV